MAADNSPPPGFELLFNGKDLAGWDLEHDAERHWSATNGMLEYDGKGQNLRTEADYGNFELWVDWKIPPGGDSGIYLRGFPQVQIWDNPAAGSGGLYNNKTHASRPLAAVDNPAGEWNTFKIKIIDDVVTVYLNDRLVVDETPLECWPNYDAKLPAAGRIELQHHGSKLWFKNIYIKELPPAEWCGLEKLPDNFTELLAERAKAASPPEKGWLLRIMAKFGGAKAVSAIMEAARSPDAALRIAAMEALGSAGATSAIPLLAEAACSVNAAERAAARRALARLRSDEAAHEMLARLADESEAPELRLEMALALQAQRCAEAAAAMLQAAKAPQRELRVACISALGCVAGPEAAVELLELLKNTSDTEEQAALAGAVAQILVRAGAPQREVEAVCAACDAASSGAKAALLAVLPRMACAQALAAARRALKSGDARARTAALRAMAEWPDSGPMPELLEAATDAADPEMRALALAGYARMINLAAGSAVPFKDAAALYAAAFDMAERPEEQRLILEYLGNVPAPEALEFLEQVLAEMNITKANELLAAAETAYVKAATALSEKHPEQAKAALRRFCASSNNTELLKAAARQLEQIK